MIFVSLYLNFGAIYLNFGAKIDNRVFSKIFCFQGSFVLTPFILKAPNYVSACRPRRYGTLTERGAFFFNLPE